MSAKLAGRNLTFYILHFGIRFLSPVVVTPFLAKILGPGDYADYVVWNACVWTASLLMEFGFYLYAINATATAETPPALSRVVSSVVTAKLALAPLAIVGYLAGAYVLGLTAREPLAVGIGVIALFCYGASFAWYFQGLQRGGTAVLIDAVPQVTQLLLVLVLVNGPGQIWRVTALQALAPVTTLIVSLVLINRRRLDFSWMWTPAVEAIRAAFPYFVERASFALYSTATPIIIALLSTKHQAAFYGLAEKTNVLLTALVFAATQALSPIVAVRARAVPPDWSLSLKIVAALTAVTLLSAVIAILGIGPLVHLVLGPQYADVTPVAQAFCLVAVLMTFQLAVSNFIVLPGGRAATLIRSSTLALVVTLLLQVMLVPRYGAIGSVMARACGEVAIALFLTWVAVQVLRRKQPSADAGATAPPVQTEQDVEA